MLLNLLPMPWRNSSRRCNRSRICKRNYWHFHNIILNETMWSSKKRRITMLASLISLFYLILYLQGYQAIPLKLLMLPLLAKLRQQLLLERKFHPQVCKHANNTISKREAADSATTPTKWKAWANTNKMNLKKEIRTHFRGGKPWQDILHLDAMQPSQRRMNKINNSKPFYPPFVIFCVLNYSCANEWLNWLPWEYS